VRSLWRRGLIATAALSLLLGGGVAGAQEPAPARGSPERLVEDYIRLYAGETLDRWRALFHPALSVADPDAGGGIRLRALDEFFATQKERFDRGHEVSERLENVRIQRGRRIASVSADFIFSLDGTERRGKLGLHLAEGSDGWRIVALLFSYDRP